jgi:hypothetical protein
MKPLNKKIPFHPMPHHGELFKGYNIRLASRNGRDELKDFVGAFEINANLKGLYVVGSEKYDEFIRVLATSLEVDVEYLSAFFKDEKSKQMMDWLSVKHMAIRRPSICPSCVAKNGYLKADWHLYYATHCKVHECKLWKYCPRCGHEFNWRGSLLVGCTSCNLKWKDVSPIKDELPVYQIAMETLCHTEKEELLAKLMNNLKVSLRPFDASIQSPRDIDLYVDDLTSYIEHAYHLATSDIAIADLKSRRREHWSNAIGSSNYLAMFDKLEAANEPTFDDLRIEIDNPIDTTSNIKEASHMVLSPHRRLNANQENAFLELSWCQLESVFKMTKPQITLLIKGGVISGRMHINSPQKVSPSRVDDVIRYFKDIKINSLPLVAANDEFIAWGDEKALSHYKVKTYELAKYIANGEINVFSPLNDDHLFESFSFNKTELNDLTAANSPQASSPDKKSA